MTFSVSVMFRRFLRIQSRLSTGETHRRKDSTRKIETLDGCSTQTYCIYKRRRTTMIIVRFRQDNDQRRRKGYRRAHESTALWRCTAINIYCTPSPLLLFFSPQLSLAHEHATGMAHSILLTLTITAVLRVQWEVGKRKQNLFVPPTSWSIALTHR
jgi:hypothetical protein